MTAAPFRMRAMKPDRPADRLPRRVRRAVNRAAAAAARLAAAEAERRARQALHAHAADLLAAGRELDDVLIELQQAA